MSADLHESVGEQRPLAIVAAGARSLIGRDEVVDHLFEIAFVTLEGNQHLKRSIGRFRFDFGYAPLNRSGAKQSKVLPYFLERRLSIKEYFSNFALCLNDTLLYRETSCP